MRNANDDTNNDEAIARAIAESEGGLHSHSTTHHVQTSPRNNNNVPNCPLKHGLELFQASNSQRVTCNGCKQRVREGDQVWSCVQCNFDCCQNCYTQNRTFPGGALYNNGNRTSNSNRRTSPYPMPNFNNPFAVSNDTTIPSTNHMCLVPCSIGNNITVEMLVDTGAQSSVLSTPLVRQLGLTNRLDRRYQGVAAGVGRARISGKIRNVVCTFGVGHVEFLMDFIVLDVEDQLAILGLDQMRKYKCLVDMGNEKLIFGGVGGVEVQMLPANETHFDIRSLNGGCALM